ncbi:P-loop containing nucleoside triphosphate hydrolase protein [Coniochaeta sp. 2T2.1]|nr:P-loop containing nucleoside triphosphate hydrolase protein [Coniochaeta sp. 2T2.1]
MKVLVVGLPRTGTQSIANALTHLGIGPVYHMKEVGKNKHAGLWVEAIDAKFEGVGNPWGREDLERILAGFEAVADYPAAIFPEELIAAYPEAKIILSTRDEDGWYASMMSTLIHWQMSRPADDPSPISQLARKYHGHCWGNDFPENGRTCFREHNALVKEASKGRDFLELQAKDGWVPLCEFLGVPVPEGVPFPRSDDWLEYKKMVEKQKQDAAE